MEGRSEDRVIRKNGSKTRNLYKYKLLFTE